MEGLDGGLRLDFGAWLVIYIIRSQAATGMLGPPLGEWGGGVQMLFLWIFV